MWRCYARLPAFRRGCYARIRVASSSPSMRGLFPHLGSCPALSPAVVLMLGLMVGSGCAHSGTPMQGSCRELPTVEECQAARGATSARARVELLDARFDGRTLHGRLLVTTEEGHLLLDKRLIESVVLTTESVVECETGRRLSFIEMDVLARPPRDEDLLVLTPGYWFGKDVRMWRASRRSSGSMRVKGALRACGSVECFLPHEVKGSRAWRGANRLEPEWAE